MKLCCKAGVPVDTLGGVMKSAKFLRAAAFAAGCVMAAAGCRNVLEGGAFGLKAWGLHISGRGMREGSARALVARGGSKTFYAEVEGADDRAVSWEIPESGRKAGTRIVTGKNGEGRLTVDPDEEPGEFTVRVMPAVSPSDYADIHITVTDAVVNGMTVTPKEAEVTPGGTLEFRSAVDGDGKSGPVPQAVAWEITDSGRSEGTVIRTDNSHKYILLTVGENEALDTLNLRATSVVNEDIYAAVTVTVRRDGGSAGTGVTVTPAAAGVARGGTLEFRAEVTGTGNFETALVWSVDGPGRSAGTDISSDGVLTVAADEPLDFLTVRAAFAGDSAEYGAAAVTVTGPAEPPETVITGITVSPSAAGVVRGKTAIFLAKVTGTGNPAQDVVWSVSGALKAGTYISTDGELTVDADEKPGEILTVRAVSDADSYGQGTAIVTVLSGEN